MKVIFEPPIVPHDADLYSAETTVPVVEGFAAIGESELREYAERGYLAVRRGFSSGQTEAAIAELLWMMSADEPRCESVYFESTIREYIGGGAADERHRFSELPPVSAEIRARLVRKFMGFSATHPILAAFMQDRGLLSVVGQIIGEPVHCFQEMALIKPPYGQEKPWHQDHAYFNLPLETKVVGAWIALADVTPEMGCMHVISGAHTRGPQLHFKRRDWQICDDQIHPHRRMAISMQAGDVLLFDSKLPHGTPINKTTHQRFAIQFHFAPSSAITTSDEQRMAIFGSEGKDVRC
jgi:phytanoyl-CoA hydroxylase